MAYNDIPVVPAWQASLPVQAGVIVLSPSGTLIRRSAAGTTRASYDATEAAAWTALSVLTGAATSQNLFGDGSDGTVLFDGTNTFAAFASKASSTYTLTRDVFGTTVTIGSGVTVVPGPFAIYATIAIVGTGTVDNTGVAGAANGTAGAGGGVLGRLGNGVAGGAGNTGAGSAGTTTASPGAPGGAGGAGASGAGGAAGAANIPASFNWIFRNPSVALTGTFSYNNNVRFLQGAAGGGGGGGDGTNKGGGGGAGAGNIFLFAPSITFSGTLKAAGGAGGSPSTGNCGGGAGGGGGQIVAYTATAWTPPTTNVAGGALGAKVGTGSNGVAGTAGNVQNIVVAANGGDAAWINVAAFSNSWVNFGSGYTVARYRKDATGRVYVEGTISGGSSGTVAFQLPAGYRLSTSAFYPAAGSGYSSAGVIVDTSGNVSPGFLASAPVALGFSFLADS